MDWSSAELTVKLLQLPSPLTRRGGDGPARSARWGEVTLSAG